MQSTYSDRCIFLFLVLNRLKDTHNASIGSCNLSEEEKKWQDILRDTFQYRMITTKSRFNKSPKTNSNSISKYAIFSQNIAYFDLNHSLGVNHNLIFEKFKIKFHRTVTNCMFR